MSSVLTRPLLNGMAIGDLIKAFRLELDMFQSDFAKALGVTEGTVSKWETNDVRPSRQSLVKLIALAKAREEADYEREFLAHAP